MTRTRDDVAADVRRLLQEAAGAAEDQLYDAAELVDDLGLDSLRLVDMMLLLEGRYGMRLPLDQVVKVRTIGDAIDLVFGLATVSDPA